MRRGTSALRPRATPHDALTAMQYDLMIVCVDKGVDLLALEKLMATFSD